VNIDPGYLFALCGVVRDVIVAHYADLDVALPERRLRSPGLPAYDCDELVIWVERVFPFDGNVTVETVPTLYADPAYMTRGAELSICILRCLPDGDAQGNPPAVADEEAATAAILADPVLIWQALIAAHEDETLPGCGAMAFGSWESVTPDGLLGGGVVRVLLSLE